MNIAGQRAVTLPVVGTVQNYDTVLGRSGITGLKTGNNDADPGAFLFTATTHIGGKDVSLTGAVMGAVDLNTALQNAVVLSDSMQRNFEQVNIAQAGQQVGDLRAKWGRAVPIISQQAIQVVRWKSMPLTETHQLHTDVRSGTIGTFKVSSGQAHAGSTLTLKQPLVGPSFWWRLTRH
jgi:D-alanyl-D-alanine carboxypeptidase (penicillin-binding protein 5/6)